MKSFVSLTSEANQGLYSFLHLKCNGLPLTRQHFSRRKKTFPPIYSYNKRKQNVRLDLCLDRMLLLMFNQSEQNNRNIIFFISVL